MEVCLCLVLEQDEDEAVEIEAYLCSDCQMYYGECEVIETVPGVECEICGAR